jgi:hypothetical protein
MKMDETRQSLEAGRFRICPPSVFQNVGRTQRIGFETPPFRTIKPLHGQEKR